MIRNYLLHLLKESTLELSKICDKVIQSKSEYYFNGEMTSSDLISHHIMNCQVIIFLLNHLNMNITPLTISHLLSEEFLIDEVIYRIKNIFRTMRDNKDMNLSKLEKLESVILKEIADSKSKLMNKSDERNLKNFSFLF